jgi:hypothetical protein
MKTALAAKDSMSWQSPAYYAQATNYYKAEVSTTIQVVKAYPGQPQKSIGDDRGSPSPATNSST